MTVKHTINPFEKEWTEFTLWQVIYYFGMNKNESFVEYWSISFIQAFLIWNEILVRDVSQATVAFDKFQFFNLTIATFIKNFTYLLAMQNNEKMKSANMLNYSHLRWFDFFLDPVIKIGNSGESIWFTTGTTAWKNQVIGN